MEEDKLTIEDILYEISDAVEYHISVPGKLTFRSLKMFHELLDELEDRLRQEPKNNDRIDVI